ncbi:hypothetical protein MTR67_031197 [Solanum verrucosum]|uniref:Uncharacterized protein n=1 Tax=Solanum verrucosum TaxID=315347 RepID=A0AAF0U225_SOLVR|nr:hypothetical protein MTR67_031197 [Solanum verrucosum]
MDISHLIKHAQQIEVEKLKERVGDSKSERTGGGNFSNSRFGGECRTNYWQRFSCKQSLNALTPKFNNYMVTNINPQGGNGVGCSISTYTMCGKNHDGKYVVGTDGFFGCGKSGHKVKDFPLQDNNNKDGRKAHSSGSSLGAPRQNIFYDLQIREDHEDYLNVVTSM